MYYLAKNPTAQETLRKEVFNVLPNVDSKLGPDSLNHIPYFKACLKESMRLSPVIGGNQRAAGKDLVLNGYQIPKNVNY